MRAYLDIETSFSGGISVIGIYRPDTGTTQLIGSGVHDLNLYTALAGVDTIVTFNGTGFDLPVIRRRLLADLRNDFGHRDLLYVCRKRGLRGGLKVVEQTLGIARDSAGISGYDAPRLWERYEIHADQCALDTLLTYNYEDVVNLATLEALLDATPVVQPTATMRRLMQ
ncbi:exonuclease-like protein [Oscillochloris trichoides DG-6]|uniref:Exonuclease-like protein n=1 Tax=Oscillochloris trichoides DG-6 TaxID=765420 RepID=E1IG41_9CHLR|nr:ribonuclease H-like domain-containing protein [Oscillochloris trichoides]EFO79839.1 exonuclease-like protein [Oscillochloris trichoides DG-6]